MSKEGKNVRHKIGKFCMQKRSQISSRRVRRQAERLLKKESERLGD